jgi:glucosamine-6-phosphate deaminase
MGIGENGHIAFNDPHVASFCDRKTVKVVELDEKCRTQQVNDGCFASLDLVPKYAITLTIPALMKAQFIICVVPGSRKAEAIKATLTGRITEECPASILRRHDNAILFCDRNSANYIRVSGDYL